MDDDLRVEWAPSALTDLEAMLDYLAARESPSLAASVGDELLEAADSLTSLPHRGRRVPELSELGVEGFRELLVGPYRLVYRVVSRTVGIVALLDGRRDLGDVLVERALRPR